MVVPVTPSFPEHRVVDARSFLLSPIFPSVFFSQPSLQRALPNRHRSIGREGVVRVRERERERERERDHLSDENPAGKK